MKLSNTLIGTFQKRYKRFFCDIQLENGTLITAFIPNTGRLTSCLKENQRMLLTHSSNPKRKLAYTVEYAEMNNEWICINTHRANQLIKEALASQQLNHLFTYSSFKPEIKHRSSRFDFALFMGDTLTDIIEVKSVTLKTNSNTLAFPDAPSTRAQKHLNELLHFDASPINTHLIYVLCRNSTTSFEPEQTIDPIYAKLYDQLKNSSTQVHFIKTLRTDTEIALDLTAPFR